MSPFGFSLNPRRVAKGMVLGEIRTTVQELVNALGHERIAWCVENRRSLASIAPKTLEMEYRRKARTPGYARISQFITDEEFVSTFPGWLQDLIASYGDRGHAWLQEQVVWIRGFFTGGKDGRTSEVTVGASGGLYPRRDAVQAVQRPTPGPAGQVPDAGGASGEEGPASRGTEEDK